MTCCVVVPNVPHHGSNVIEMRNQHKEAFLKVHGVKLGFMSPFVKAACFALQDQPVVNAGIFILLRDIVMPMYDTYIHTHTYVRTLFPRTSLIGFNVVDSMRQ